MTLHVPFNLQTVLFAGLQPGSIDLATLKAQQVQSLLAQPIVALEALESRSQIAKKTEVILDPTPRLGGVITTGSIEPLALQWRRNEAQFLALAMNPYQLRRQSCEQGKGDGLVLNKDSVAPFPTDLPSHDQFIRIAGQTRLLEDWAPLLAFWLEHTRDGKNLLSRPNQLTGCPHSR